MKIIILNIISIIVTIGWGIFIYLGALGSAYGNTNAQPSDLYPYKVLLVVLVIATILSLILSHIDAKRAILWASIPLIVFVIGLLSVWVYGIKAKSEQSNKSNQMNISSKTDADKKIATLSKDYICKGYPKAGGAEELFITHDKKYNVLTWTVVDKNDGYTVGTNPLGKINGTNLEVFEKHTADNKLEFADCYDTNSKTIYDNYTLMYNGEQKLEDYHL